jgi:hypothetical protein
MKGLDLTPLGQNLTVPFLVRRLSRPQVIWLNERWFTEQGIDLGSEDIRREIVEKILAEFAYAVPVQTDPEDGFLTETGSMSADRYGLSHGAWHGGSGRSGIVGEFNAKGIGPTPLMSDTADGKYATGMMFVAEALLEAIISEICGAELPLGAVPLLAIIDLGFSSPVKGPRAMARRAIAVRPNFVRPAHFERSIFFGTAGRSDSDQSLDAIRVRDAVRAVTGGAIFGDVTADRFLADIALTSARQIGAALAHRLWLGLFTSANRTVHGALADFGAVRGVGNWMSCRGSPPEQFGRESECLRATMTSLHWYFSKYSTCPPGRQDLLEAQTSAWIQQAFGAACLSAARIDSAAPSALPDALLGYFRRQQERVVSERESWDGAWLLDALCPSWRAGPAREEFARDVRQEIETAIADDGADAVTQAGRFAALLQWLTPRPQLRQETLVEATLAFSEGLHSENADCPTEVRRFIDRYVSQLRRTWPGLPATFRVSGQSVSGAMTILDGVDLTSGRRGVMVRNTAQATDGHDRVLGHGHAAHADRTHGGWVWIDARSDAGSKLSGQSASAPHARSVDFVYPYPRAFFSEPGRAFARDAANEPSVSQCEHTHLY